MKIIEALKELPVLEKRLLKQSEKIQEYASYATNIGPVFDTVEEQKSQVQSLVRSNLDLIERYCKLRNVLNKTNTTIKVKIEGDERTISEWITFREKGYGFTESTFRRLNDAMAKNHFQQPCNFAEGQSLTLIYCYDEKEKNKALEKAEKVYNQIDSTLEIVNATTDLIEEI